MAGIHSRLILLPTVEHLLQLSVVFLIEESIHVGGAVVLNAEHLLDGGDSLGAVEHGSVSLTVPIV